MPVFFTIRNIFAFFFYLFLSICPCDEPGVLRASSGRNVSNPGGPLSCAPNRRPVGWAFSCQRPSGIPRPKCGTDRGLKPELWRKIKKYLEKKYTDLFFVPIDFIVPFDEKNTSSHSFS